MSDQELLDHPGYAGHLDLALSGQAKTSAVIQVASLDVDPPPSRGCGSLDVRVSEPARRFLIAAGWRPPQ